MGPISLNKSLVYHWSLGIQPKVEAQQGQTSMYELLGGFSPQLLTNMSQNYESYPKLEIVTERKTWLKPQCLIYV